MSYDVVALGELLVDFTWVGTDADGYPTLAAHPGGAPANFLAALTRYGASAALLGKVGDDAFGRLLADTLLAAGIGAEGLTVDPAVFTTLAFVTLDRNGDRSFSFARKPGADICLRAEEVDLTLIEDARVFHFGSLSLTGEPACTATRRAVAHARACGKMVTFDPNLRTMLWPSPDRAREEIFWGLAQADVVKLSGEELAFLYGNVSREAGVRRILEERDVKLVFLTLGAEGCLYANGQTWGQVPALRGISPLDTTGAGDIFGGSAVWGLLRSGKRPEALGDAELEEITRFACAAAGLSTTRPGGISSVPGLEEVLERMGRDDP